MTLRGATGLPSEPCRPALPAVLCLVLGKAERVLGWTPRYSNAQALVRTYEWYLAHKDGFAKASGVTHRVPWKQGAIGILKRFF